MNIISTLNKKRITSMLGAAVVAVATPALLAFGAATAQATVTPPATDIWFDPSLGALNVHVLDNVGTNANCVYRADWYSQNFFLPAGGIANILIAPSFPEYRNWSVDVTCDSGVWAHMTYFY